MAGNRTSIRLQGYDYTAAGAYFVTICAFEKGRLFGDVVDRRMTLNTFGQVLARVWARTVNDGRLPEPYDFVVMPNHVHGVVWLPGRRDAVTASGVRASRLANKDGGTGYGLDAVGVDDGNLVDDSPLRQTAGVSIGSLGALIGSFKGQSARAINRLRGWPGGPVWQRGYYERVVRGNGELGPVRQYILDNPAKWMDDPNNVG